ncbi:MAG: hypothetical protein PHN72_00175 [Bacilli bacterium]|nr:hypothetical protein [Bacilli bacterium]
MRIREKINILSRVKMALENGQMIVSEKLLGLLENTGINLSGYGELVPVKVKKKD